MKHDLKTGTERIKVALAPFLRSCPSVITLGIRACPGDYSREEVQLLHDAERVFFPTPRFVDIFHATGKPTFPSPTTYRYQRSRSLQQLLFKYLECPHPRTRIYFGRLQKQRILRDFGLPLLVMGPRTGSGTTYPVHCSRELEQYIHRHHAVLVQEAKDWTERIRILCVHFQCVGVLRSRTGRSNTSPFEPMPLEHPDLKDLLNMTGRLLRAAHLDDIVVEWGYETGKWQLLGMTRPPVLWKTPEGLIHRHHHICTLIGSGAL